MKMTEPLQKNDKDLLIAGLFQTENCTQDSGMMEKRGLPAIYDH